MEELYKKYLNSFNNLSLEDKRAYVVNNLEEMIKVLYKINLDYNKHCDIIPAGEYETEEEYLTELFKTVITLKGVCGNTIGIISDNLYEGAKNE